MADAYRTTVGPVPGRPTYRFAQDHSDISIAEYNSVRTDCLQGLAGQQSILAWSFAAIGVIFAAGLTLKAPGLAHTTTIRAGLFGLAVPAIAFGASVAWLGEIFRMERDAHFLRLMERTTWTEEQREAKAVTDAWVGRTPLLYNAWVAHSEPIGRNRVVGYIGGLIIYSSFVFGGFAVCAILVDSDRLVIMVAEAIASFGYVAATFFQLRHILDYSKLPAVDAGAQLAGRTGRPPVSPS
jgi:hypothetical protein